MNINPTNEKPIPKIVNNPELIYKYFMLLYDSSVVQYELLEWYKTN